MKREPQAPVARAAAITVREIHAQKRGNGPGGTFYAVFKGKTLFSEWHTERETAEDEAAHAARMLKREKRRCMTCRHEFPSQGNHNRMCGDCRQLSPGMI